MIYIFQAHAKICTVCGKVVRDMRKHRLIHTGEKPFQCDRCSYRCARSSSLKRHLATHLNAAVPQAPQPSSVPVPQVVPEEPKLATHLPMPAALPPVVSVAMPPHPSQQQQQPIPSHHLSQLPHIQQHPQLQELEPHHELAQHQYDPNALTYRAMKFA